MAYSNKIAEALSRVDETDKIEFAHFLANNLAPEEVAKDSAYVRQIVAAFDRFAAPSEE